MARIVKEKVAVAPTGVLPLSRWPKACCQRGFKSSGETKSTQALVCSCLQWPPPASRLRTSRPPRCSPSAQCKYFAESLSAPEHATDLPPPLRACPPSTLRPSATAHRTRPRKF
ncbi:unnamed protein product, partial [Iphiclides podalirius]